MAEANVSDKKTLYIAAFIVLFSCLAGLVVFLARAGVITVPMGILMLVGLVGIYFGLGILVAVHFMVRKLD